MQNDIIALLDTSGKVVVKYYYDAWGNATVIYKNGWASTGAAKNSFRYRGYYYDIDLDLYYLNSRYYDSNTSRFLSADTIIDGNAGIIGYSLYIYVANNPVNHTDSTGKWIIKDAIKWVSKNIVEPVANTVKKIGQKTSATATKSINFNLNLGSISYDFSAGVSADTKGNVALQATLAVNFSIADPSVAITGVSTVTNAPTVYNLEDFGTQTGGSVGIDINGVAAVVGGDVVFIPDEQNNTTYYGQSVNVGVGTPGKEFHAGMSVTKTLTSINIFDITYKIIDKIRDWRYMFKKVSSFILFFLLVYLQSINIYANQNKEDNLNIVNLVLIDKSPAQTPINCFDVNENHNIVIATENSFYKKILVYNSIGEFIYGYNFKYNGGVAVEWAENDNLKIYLLKSNLVLFVDKNGEIWNKSSFGVSYEDNSYLNSRVFRSEKTVGDTVYKYKNSLPIINTRNNRLLIAVSSDGERVVYDATAELVVDIVLCCLAAFCLLFITVFVIKKSLVKQDKNQ